MRLSKLTRGASTATSLMVLMPVRASFSRFGQFLAMASEKFSKFGFSLRSNCANAA